MPTCLVCDRDIRDAKRSNAKYHPECRGEYKRRWHQENKARVNESMKSNYYANREVRLEQVAQYKRDNKDKVNATNRKRNSRLQRTGWCTRRQVEAFYTAAKRLTETTGVQFSVDHIVPLFGDNVCGLHCPDNLQIIPLADNLRKHKSL